MEEENIDINNIEIDKLQMAIENMAQLEENSIDAPLKNPLDAMADLTDEEIKERELAAEYKKYVFKINKKYHYIIDKMTPEEREQYFNDMLEFYTTTQAKIEKQYKIKDSIIHILTVVLTCVIGLPIMLFVTNKSIEMTVSNYKQTQTNFVNLYRDKGGIKKKDLTNLRDLK